MPESFVKVFLAEKYAAMETRPSRFVFVISKADLG
jgi:hypothetical protein